MWTLEVLTRLRIKGFGLSIDDFGTGYSNIESLRQFPFTELKIDKSYVQEAMTDPFAKACVNASVSLGKKLDLTIVAEGVETREHLEYMERAGARSSTRPLHRENPCRRKILLIG